MEYRLHLQRQVVGDHGLSDPIGDRRNAQNPNPPARLRNVHSLHRRRKIAARGESIPDPIHIVPKIFLELSQGHAIHTRCALVSSDLPESVPHLLFGNIKRFPERSRRAHPIPPAKSTVDQAPTPSIGRPLRSTPITGASTLLRADPPPHAATVLSPAVPASPCRIAAQQQPSSVGVCVPEFPVVAAVRAHVASIPDTTWPISAHPPGSSRSRRDTPVLMPTVHFGTSSAIHLRSSSRTPPDTVSPEPFPSSLTTSQLSLTSSMRRFETPQRRAIPKDQILHRPHGIQSRNHDHLRHRTDLHSREGEVVLFNPGSVVTTRYRPRGTTIPSPWPQLQMSTALAQ